MIDNLNLENFKCFENINIRTRQINILSGLNGVGKSSIVQSLLLLRQSFQEIYNDIIQLELDGQYISLGTGADVLFEEAELDTISFSLEESTKLGKGDVFYEFDYDKNGDFLVKKDNNNNNTIIKDSFFKQPIFYLQADRLGPQKIYDFSEYNVRNYNLGNRGEYALHFLVNYSQKKIKDNDPRCIDVESHLVIDIVNYYLKQVSPGVNIGARAITEINSVAANYSFDRDGDIQSRGYKPINVGFGVSYSLPVIAALVLAEAGSTLIIENPEAHLHPKGQTTLALLAARAAAAGVQVFIETHSDHFLNGIRLAVKKAEIAAEDVALPFFSRDGIRSSFVQPQLQRDGRLDFWPEGFFDQNDINLAGLII